MVTEIALATILDRCQSSPIGKLLPDSLYVHWSALPALDPVLQDYDQQARQLLGDSVAFTLVKFHCVRGTGSESEQAKVSYLLYPDFDRDPHPALHTSIQVDLATGQVNQRDYSQNANPPILHCKGTFVTSDYPLYPEFAELTR